MTKSLVNIFRIDLTEINPTRCKSFFYNTPLNEFLIILPFKKNYVLKALILYDF